MRYSIHHNTRGKETTHLTPSCSSTVSTVNLTPDGLESRVPEWIVRRGWERWCTRKSERRREVKYLWDPGPGQGNQRPIGGGIVQTRGLWGSPVIERVGSHGSPKGPLYTP